ncbi:lipopolysaccharide biosynthesis protein [Paenibacillus sp. PR3]|uniref:Lipopolysaccharide biosynthesis protein n=1 Tax=Paenibacillus terricola TaxID=2763503 RepID=A0ABR8MXK6_9BACL|nr:lipopolysaccharide biosynthesis protein [Paenibacillus terricola]
MIVGENDVKELEIKDYVRIIRKRLWWIVTLVVVATLLSGIVSKFVIKPEYEASTKIIVNKTSDVENQQLNTDTVNTNLKLIDTYKEIIKTPAIMDVVVEMYPEFGINAEGLIEKVSVSSVNNTQVMTLVVRDQSYEKAARIVNAVSKVFQSEIPALMNVQNVSILNYAKEDGANKTPVSPNVMLNTMIAFVLTLLIGVGVAFLLEFMDDTLKSEEDVQQILGLPTLAMINRVSASEMNKSQEAEIIAKQPAQAGTRPTTSRKAGEMEHVAIGK